MGSSQSTSNRNDDQSSSGDQWWSIENDNLNLSEPTTNTTSGLSERTDNIIINNSESANINNLEENNISDRDYNSTEDQQQSASESRHTAVATDKIPVPGNSSSSREQTYEEFKSELRLKRMARQEALGNLTNELTRLRRELAEERELTRRLRNGEHVVAEKKDAETSMDLLDPIVDEDPDVQEITRRRTEHDSSRTLRSELAEVQLALQLANADNLSLSTELGIMRKQVASLKEVIACTKQILEVREEQVVQLKTKIREIEDSLAERELRIMSDDLRQEYDRQLANIRNLRQLYEERARVSAAERENLLRQISIKKDELQAETEKAKNLEERISSLENDLETSHKKITDVKSVSDEYRFENKELKDEMAVINKLFSEMLMGFNGTDSLDIDRLTTMLEENRDLLNEMATKEIATEGACLPKLLFDIVKQANSNSNSEAEEDTTSEPATTKVKQQQQLPTPSAAKVVSAQEIIGNLPKVWRVLMELLSHYKIEKVQFQENGQSEDCYKSVQTPSGTKVELSVSKTYIKLKDLILEKKALQKDTNKLKTLNMHLENRLNEQEKRLSAVSLELTKTWHLVGKMQRQHRQLHTHEQILRYQLQQKRRLLNELKEELEYCRKKWAAARAKNAESQLQCDDLRKEFAKRKLEDANNSTESGYSDGPVSDEEDTIRHDKKKLLEIFDRPHKVERMHSASPARSPPPMDAFLRRSSAPPSAMFLSEIEHTAGEIDSSEPLQNVASASIVSENVMASATVAEPPSKVSTLSTGAVPKITQPKTGVPKVDLPKTELPKPELPRAGLPPKSGLPKAGLSKLAASKAGLSLSYGKKRERTKKQEGEESLEQMFMRISGTPIDESTAPSTITEQSDDDAKRTDRAERIQRLEEQCKSLIAQVIETSDCREKLEVQLCEFQGEMPPAQRPVQFDEYVPRKSEERQQALPAPSESNSAASSSDSQSTRVNALAEYASKRNERLKHLEEESKQLMSKIKRTTDRTQNIKTRLDKIHSRCANSRENSAERNGSSEEAELPAKAALLKVQAESSEIKTTAQQAQSSTESKMAAQSPQNSSEIKMTTTESAQSPSEIRMTTELAQSPSEIKMTTTESAQSPSEIRMTTESAQSPSEIRMTTESAPSPSEIRMTTESAQSPSEIKMTTQSAPDTSNTETNLEENKKQSVRLTAEEEAYTARRSERLKRLEEESKKLLSKLSYNSNRGTQMNTRLDELHSKYKSEDNETVVSAPVVDIISRQTEKIEDISIETASVLPVLEFETDPLQTAGASNTISLEERLRQLEEEGDKLLAKFIANSMKGNENVVRLDEIHSRMVAETAESSAPPPPVEELPPPESEASKEFQQKLVTYSAAYEANMKKYEERLQRLQESKRLLSRLSESSNSESETVYYPRSRNNTDCDKSDEEGAVGISLSTQEETAKELVEESNTASSVALVDKESETLPNETETSTSENLEDAENIVEDAGSSSNA